MTRFSLILAVVSLQMSVQVCGCATSFAPEEASTSLTAGPQADPGAEEQEIRVQQLFIRGLTRAMIDDHRQAIYLFEQAIQIDDKEPAIFHALAESHAALGELDTALYYSQRAFRLSPSNRDYMLSLVDLQRRTRNPEGALETYQQWLTVFPNDVEARMMAGEVMIEMGKEQEALAQFRDIIAKDGENLEAQFRMLQLYNGMGNVDGMLQTAEAMREIDPTNNTLLLILADIHLERNEIDKAIEVLEQAVDNDSGDAKARSALAELYRETGRYDDADRLSSSIAGHPEVGEADRIAAASELYERSDNDEAAAEQAASALSEIIDEGGATPDVLFMLGNLRFRNGEYAEASDLLLEALDSDPKHPDEWARAATSLFYSDDLDLAARTADEALMLFPGQYPLLNIATEVALKAGDYERALSLASESAAILEESGGEVHLRALTEERIGDAHAGLGHADDATTHWKRAVELDPGLESAREKLQPNP